MGETKQKIESLKRDSSYSSFLTTIKEKKSLKSASIELKLSKSRLQFYIDNPEYLDYIHLSFAKPVALYGLNGELLKEFPSLRMLSSFLGVSNKTINKSIRNKMKQPIKNKYIIKYIEKEDQKI